MRKKGQKGKKDECRHEDEHGHGVSWHLSLFSTSRVEGGCWGAVGNHQYKRGIMGE